MDMLRINDRIQIPETEFQWRFVRSGGPGGQNVNKVASRAVLRWDLVGSASVPEGVKARLRTQEKRRLTAAGLFVVSSQRYRDQERNRHDCLAKLCEAVRRAAMSPRPRRPTRPTRASREMRLQQKRRRAAIKSRRRLSPDE
jgi:ribosome-associated protein